MNFFPFCRIFRQDNKKEMWLIFSDAGDVFCQSLFHIRACWAYFTLVLKLCSPCHGSSTVDVTKHLTVSLVTELNNLCIAMSEVFT